MPPKGAAAAAGKADKAKAQAKAKAAEDKTFGLKNKNKSTKVQQYVNNVQKNANKNLDAYGLPIEAKKKERAKADELKKEEALLFQVAIKQPKVPEGVDPKSMVCEFFRHGQCTKGAKCKFAHDLAVERKSHKIDLFTDQRNLGGEEEDKGMEEWDQETLERAIKEKHASENNNKPTAIICKFFLEAVEKRLYGWFWKCPNGGDCKYRHALPPGYLLKSQMKELLEEEARNAKDAADIIEEERRKLDARTPITEEVFRAWHRAKVEARKRARDEAMAERLKKGLLNGREIFQQEGFVAEDDTSAADDYAREDDEESKIREMLEAAQRAAATARERAAEARAAGEVMEAVKEDDEEEDVYAMYEQEEDDGAGPSGSGGAGPSGTAGPKTTLKLNKEEGEELFGDDDDDDELDLEDDDDEEDLEDLEQHVRKMHT